MGLFLEYVARCRKCAPLGAVKGQHLWKSFYQNPFRKSSMSNMNALREGMRFARNFYHVVPSRSGRSLSTREGIIHLRPFKALIGVDIPEMVRPNW